MYTNQIENNIVNFINQDIYQTGINKLIEQQKKKELLKNENIYKDDSQKISNLNKHSIEKEETKFNLKNRLEFKTFNKLELLYDQIFIINLKHRTDRWNKITQIMKYLGITNYKRFEAINGNHPNIKQSWMAKRSSVKNYRVNSPGAFGYLVSYYYILYEAIQSNFKNILVLDDDIIPHKMFNQIIENHNLPKNYKLIYYGSCHQYHCDLDVYNKINDNDTCYSEKIKYKIEKENTSYPELFNIKMFNKNYGFGNIDGSFMMGISHIVFSDLFYLIKKAIYPFDSGPLREIYFNDNYNCYIFQPNLVIQNMNDSDIQPDHSIMNSMKLIRKWGWNLNDYYFF